MDITPQQRVVCISHADTDGLFSAMLVKRKYPWARCMQTNYGKEFDESKLGDITFVTDFSFDSIDTMKKIAEKTQLIWIDHHTVVDQAIEAGFNPQGLRRKDCSAAKLVWEYLYPGEAVPAAVQYVSDYDTWNWTNNINALYFHYGVEMVDLKCNDRRSDKLFNQILTDANYIERISLIGKKINDYIQLHNSIVCKDAAFETELDGVKAVACNIKNTNSLLFDSINEKYKDYPFRILFSYFANVKAYRVSVFSTDIENHPAFEIARAHGGNGHPGAAGFTCQELPFKLPKTYGDVSYENILRPLQEATIEDPLVRRYSNTGNIPLIWSHQYPTVLGNFSTVVVNHPTTTHDAFYSTGLSNIYSLGAFVSMTKTGWFRYRIYLLDPRLEIKAVCKELQESFKHDNTEFKIVGNCIWMYCKHMPKPIEQN